ncbi:unnamed protein product [Dicrocoelium dendriticum]|nr:unnamed protein product [Dicrocoelium dendriticum]
MNGHCCKRPQFSSSFEFIQKGDSAESITTVSSQSIFLLSECLPRSMEFNVFTMVRLGRPATLTLILCTVGMEFRLNKTPL